MSSQHFIKSRLEGDEKLTEYVLKDVLSVFETYGLGAPDIFGICHAISVDAAANSGVPLDRIMRQTVATYRRSMEAM